MKRVVSRNTADHLPPPIPPDKWKSPRIARISYSENGGASCSCGWSTRNVREKVREDSIDRHLNKRHQGKGFRL